MYKRKNSRQIKELRNVYKKFKQAKLNKGAMSKKTFWVNSSFYTSKATSLSFHFNVINLFVHNERKVSGRSLPPPYTSKFIGLLLAGHKIHGAIHEVVLHAFKSEELLFQAPFLTKHIHRRSL